MLLSSDPPPPPYCVLYHTTKLRDPQTRDAYQTYIQQNALATQLGLSRLDHAYVTGSLPLASYVDTSSALLHDLLHAAAQSSHSTGCFIIQT